MTTKYDSYSEKQMEDLDANNNTLTYLTPVPVTVLTVVTEALAKLYTWHVTS
jgi:hypothetical protein